jgi:hypothetical protein
MGMRCFKFYSYNIGQFPNLWYLYHVCDIWKVNKLQLQLQHLAYKDGSTLVTLPRNVTPYRDSVDGTRDRVTYQRWLRGHVTDLFGALSVFRRRIKGMIWLRPEQMWTGNVTRNHLPLFCPSFNS